MGIEIVVIGEDGPIDYRGIGMGAAAWWRMPDTGRRINLTQNCFCSRLDDARAVYAFHLLLLNILEERIQ